MSNGIDIVSGQETKQQALDNILCLAMCSETNTAAADMIGASGKGFNHHCKVAEAAEFAFGLEVMAQRKHLEAVNDQPA